MAAAKSAAKVFIGWDPRETAASAVAEHSLLTRSSVPLAVTHLRLETLERAGLMVRKHYRDDRGILWDEISEAPMSTEFAISRFATPILAHSGWALFVDADVVFLADVAELFALADPRYAVMCVPHGKPRFTPTKMDGQLQTSYERKNWSSVMLFNCDHPSTGFLTQGTVNSWRGRLLHGFRWLKDEDIGPLPAGWNWLVNAQPRPDPLKLAHFTLGGPWLPGWKGAAHDELWLSASADQRAGG